MVVYYISTTHSKEHFAAFKVKAIPLEGIEEMRIHFTVSLMVWVKMKMWSIYRATYHHQ